MKTISHNRQQKIWDQEHKNPTVLLQMDSNEPSNGVVKFSEWLSEKGISKNLKGVELGCGKGRNVIYLAEQGFDMTGIDFSPAAIKEANKRAKKRGVTNRAHFLVHDATIRWPFKDKSVDIVIDCFATTDIESKKGRVFAKDEMIRVLKPGGYLLSYVLSTDDEFHKEMIKISPAKEKNAFFHPSTDKFEKTFEKEELLELYNDLKLIEEQRVPKATIFFGKSYSCLHHWMIFQKI